METSGYLMAGALSGDVGGLYSMRQGLISSGEWHWEVPLDSHEQEQLLLLFRLF